MEISSSRGASVNREFRMGHFTVRDGRLLEGRAIIRSHGISPLPLSIHLTTPDM